MSSVAEDVTPGSSTDALTAEQNASAPNLVLRGDTVLKVIDWVLETLAITALIALMLLTCANAMMRYVFSSPIPGSMNITLLYIMPALVFLALPRVQAVNAHIAATLVVDRLGERSQRICRVAVTVIMVLIMGVMLQGALHELAGAWGTTLGGYPALPLGPSWLFVPIGLAGAIVRGIWQIATVSFQRQQEGSMILGEQRSVNDV
ncbi:hypothetical protein CJ178_21085 [Rhodococcus sp. ACPA4]|uniref:TRAP transporter small permease n=1 Tax=Rhodococcus sp. ACPA4 TaxID=2028571 RepID=UPI000BB0ED3A|nr:TRAP transporter small permease [Rhodococcus sp. ACPA4]PBC43765.1 hypothetical protein CJ178_21085 [Rhodococcus sp. ACPA4]